MTFALSPAAETFIRHVHGQELLEKFQNEQQPFVKVDLMRSERLSVLIFTVSEPDANGDKVLRLYDPIGNAFLDCYMNECVGNKTVKDINEYHQGEVIPHDWGYANYMDVIPFVLQFEERVATHYYKKHQGYMPIIETYTLEVKNHIVSTLKGFLGGGALIQELLTAITERSSEIEAMSHYLKPKEQEGTAKMYVYKRTQTMTYPNTSMEYLLADMVKAMPGYQYFTGSKNLKDDVNMSIQELNNHCLDVEQGNVNPLITEEFHKSLLDAQIDFGVHNTTNNYTTAIKESLKKVCDPAFEKRLLSKNADERTNLEAIYSRLLFKAATELYKYYMTYHPLVVRPPVDAVARSFLCTKGLFDNALPDDGLFQKPKGIEDIGIESGFIRYLTT